MEIKVFEKGIALLLAVFPQLKVEGAIFYEYLKDIRDRDFIRAINSIIRTVKELYPGTNIIALIIEHVKISRPELTEEELEIEHKEETRKWREIENANKRI